jgi:hypothetical protein
VVDPGVLFAVDAVVLLADDDAKIECVGHDAGT